MIWSSVPCLRKFHASHLSSHHWTRTFSYTFNSLIWGGKIRVSSSSLYAQSFFVFPKWKTIFWRHTGSIALQSFLLFKPICNNTANLIKNLAIKIFPIPSLQKKSEEVILYFWSKNVARNIFFWDSYRHLKPYVAALKRLECLFWLLLVKMAKTLKIPDVGKVNF